MYKFRTNTSNNSHSKRKQKAKKKKYSKPKSKNENDIAKVETASVIPQNAIPNDIHAFLKTNNPMPCVQANQNFSHVIYFDAGFYFCNSFLMLNETFSRIESTPHKKQSRKTKSNLTSPLEEPLVKNVNVVDVIETESNNLVNVPLSLSNLVETKSEFNSIAFLYKNNLFSDNSFFILSNFLFYFNAKEAKNYENQIILSKKLPFDFYSVNNENNIYYFDYSNQPDASYRLINEFDLFFRHACNISVLKLIRDNEKYNCLNVFNNKSILIKLLLHLYLNEIIKTKYSFAIQNSQNMLEYEKIDKNLVNKIEHEHPQIKTNFTPLKSNKRSKSSIYLGNRKKVKLDKRFKSSICLFEGPNQVELFELHSSFSDSFSVNKSEQSFERKELESLEHIEIETLPDFTHLNRKARPSYIIERDCHVFGGCMDDDALDEFFISSGAVYQSWPYVYEPGFQLVPLFDIVNLPMSRSASQINAYDQNNSSNNRFKNEYSNNYNESQDELPSYSINNFEINMLHIDSKKKKKSKKKKLKKTVTCNSIESASIVENSSSFASFLSSSNESSYSYTDESSDDSESIIEYKKRHAIGLNFNSHFNKCNSRLNLSSNKNDSGFLYRKTHVENENHRKSSCESLKICQRLATSAYHKKSSSKKSKRIRFLSQKRVDFNYQDGEYVTNYVSQNFIF